MSLSKQRAENHLYCHKQRTLAGRTEGSRHLEKRKLAIDRLLPSFLREIPSYEGREMQWKAFIKVKVLLGHIPN